ncbi:TetR/AcrR family transcriptional regulator [Limnobacter humi]|uniref:TetR/AcrR family transcriptional regulator n=1 Tax=Limnobacter humi TaxID=1778671 RepID=A0ABT1WBX6_9BURK|nr:TetR/AcrR family transcriptional regulator [Limnobacter humi]MCQ8895010.1 TetR/AcrR family transcriptional regulator [Limnobacter humi]
MTQPTASPPQRAYAGKSAQERQKARRQQLIAAAIELIGQHGFAAVSIDSVCAQAGLTKRYFYEAFESREALLVASYDMVSRQYIAHILEGTAPHLTDARQLVKAGLMATFGFVKANPAKARLMMIEAQSVRSLIGQLYGNRYDEFVNLLLDFTRPFLQKPAPPDPVFRVLAKGMVGSIIHLCQGWIATDFKQPMNELVDGMERIMGGIGHELGVKGWSTLKTDTSKTSQPLR